MTTFIRGMSCVIAGSLLAAGACAGAKSKGGTAVVNDGASGSGASGSGASGSSGTSTGGSSAMAATGSNGTGGNKGSSGSSGAAGANSMTSGNGAAGSRGTAGSSSGSAGGAAGRGTSGGTAGAPSFDDVKKWIEDYAKAHPGQDGDIVGKSPSAVATDADAQRLLGLCGAGKLPVIPQLAWETGGNDHAWINPAQSALVYCVYIPVKPSSANWQYDAAADHVTADVYLLFPEQNPCKGETGANQIAKCIGDPTNFEILVDTASIRDGADVGLSLSEAMTELQLVMPDGMKVQLWKD